MTKLNPNDIKNIVNDTFKTALPILKSQINDAINIAENTHNSEIDIVTKQAIINASTKIYYNAIETTFTLLADATNESQD